VVSAADPLRSLISVFYTGEGSDKSREYGARSSTPFVFLCAQVLPFLEPSTDKGNACSNFCE
jgi:hypothetical protein